MRTTTAASRGRDSKQRGDAWEAQLDSYHATLAAQRRAYIVRVPTEARVMGPTCTDARGRTSFPAVWAGRASVDYVGVLVGGRAVAMEAKTCTSPRWHFAQALGAPTSLAAGPEWAGLALATECGALAAVVLQWGAECWVVEWHELQRMRAGGAASVAPEQLASIARSIKGPQWLEGRL